MTKIKTILCISILSISTMMACTSCYYDVFCNWICNGTGSESGYRSSCYIDVFGNEQCSDNRGNQVTCYWDVFGNYICN